MPAFHPFGVRIEKNKATVHDCQDARETGQADAKTLKRLTYGSERTHLVATLLKGEDGVWRVSTLEQADKPCTPSA
ncbi:hypothetical protein DP939_43140 [Spongiactinospora rosea]|uniref:Uncharacterized protein n=2 Tax=Spongiactinospora rosea TaxID=2248750 RepID=A0A366LJB2_9ACTN|nr:hypothetical protein DP939_43140 [Spongiactinospora rosea]